MAIEDCSMLVKLFDKVKSTADFETAFQVFDRLRRGGRPDMVIEQSRLLGQILTGQMSLNPEDVKKYNMQAKRQEILNFDVNIELDEAARCFEELKAKR